MINRHYRRRQRIPHYLAALAALALLVTAWTGRDSESHNAVPRGTDRIAVGTAESGDADTVPDSRPRARFSLMLFRFN